MFGETMDNIEKTEKVDWDQDNVEDLKKMKEENQSNTEKLNERDRFFRNDEPNKIKVNDPQETFSDKKNIIHDFVNGKWMDTLPWFEKKIWDKTISVESSENSFHVSVKWNQWWIDIVFDNIPQNAEQKDKNVQFINMKITWDVLDAQSLKYFSPEWVKEFPNGLKSSDNPKDVKNVILWIEKLIMNPEIQAVHGNKDKQKKDEIRQKEDIQKKYEKLDLLLDELKFNPEKNNEELASYLIDSTNFDEWYESYRKILLSLIVLHRHNSFVEIIDKMKNKNQENLQENTQRNADEKTIDDGELIIEFLSNNTSLRNDIVDDEEYLINQAINDVYASGNEITFLQS